MINVNPDLRPKVTVSDIQLFFWQQRQRKDVMFQDEMRRELSERILPFWKNLIDDANGGYTGYVDFNLKKNEEAEKGCILNSRILWFFSTAARLLDDITLIPYARQAYEFLKEAFVDRENGGLYWSVTYDGKPLDTTKHTYNQAFAIYGLAAYYDITHDKEALAQAQGLVSIIEVCCRDEGGYLEAFNRDFSPASNEKLSENGVEAARTMNTLLHVMEAYTELYRVAPEEKLGSRIREQLDLFAEKVYNPEKHRLEVFFDRDWNSLIDLISYGHDIEAAWLIDRACEVLSDERYSARMGRITEDLEKNIIHTAFDGKSIPQECEAGKVNSDRVWWIQCEAVNGFLNAWQKRPNEKWFLEAAKSVWRYTRQYLVDARPYSEWFWKVNAEGTPYDMPIVEPWKCPYHNGRMCLEVIRRGLDV